MRDANAAGIVPHSLTCRGGVRTMRAGGIGAFVEFSVLGSGSRGNAVLVAAGGVRILVDAGLNMKDTAARMATIGLPDARIDAVFVTHEHNDHVQGLGPVARATGAAVWCTDGTRRCVEDRLKGASRICGLAAAVPVVVGELVVEPIAKPHDAAEPVGFLVHHDGETLGVFTDLGSVDATVGEAIGRCTSLVMEANYDPGLLAAGPYPANLKSRIASPYGHLSNADAANAVARFAHRKLRTLVLAHLSEQNNATHLARTAFVQSMGPPRPGLERWVSAQERPTRLFAAAAAQA